MAEAASLQVGLHALRIVTGRAAPDNVFDMVFAKDNAADNGFNRWTINGTAYPDGDGGADAAPYEKGAGTDSNAQ